MRNGHLGFVGAGGGSRVHGGSAETGYGEGDDEGADGDVFHLRVSPWAGVKFLKDFSGQTRWSEHRVIQDVSPSESAT
jgi:hypothetical protein